MEPAQVSPVWLQASAPAGPLPGCSSTRVHVLPYCAGLCSSVTLSPVWSSAPPVSSCSAFLPSGPTYYRGIWCFIFSLLSLQWRLSVGKDVLMLTILSPEPRTGLARLVIFVEGINECKCNVILKNGCHVTGGSFSVLLGDSGNFGVLLVCP